MNNKLDLKDLDKVSGGCDSAATSAYVRFMKKLNELAYEWSNNNPDVDCDQRIKVREIADELLNSYNEKTQSLIKEYISANKESHEYQLNVLANKI